MQICIIYIIVNYAINTNRLNVFELILSNIFKTYP